jgi:hypothetical protein
MSISNLCQTLLPWPYVLVRKSVQLLLADDIAAMFMMYMQHGEGHLPFAFMFSEVYHGMLCQWTVKVIKKIFHVPKIIFRLPDKRFFI